MAPEQIDGKGSLISPRTDVYALGVLFFQLLTGRLPFTPASIAQLYALILCAERPRPSEITDGLHPDLDKLCLEMMAVDPAKRPASMAVAIDRLRRCQTVPVPTEVSTKCPHCKKTVRIQTKLLDQVMICPGCKRPIEPKTKPAPMPVPQEAPATQKMARDTERLEAIPVPDDPPPTRTASRPSRPSTKSAERPLPAPPPAPRRRPPARKRQSGWNPLGWAEDLLGEEYKVLALPLALFLGIGVALVIAFLGFMFWVMLSTPTTAYSPAPTKSYEGESSDFKK